MGKDILRGGNTSTAFGLSLVGKITSVEVILSDKGKNSKGNRVWDVIARLNGKVGVAVATLTSMRSRFGATQTQFEIAEVPAPNFSNFFAQKWVEGGFEGVLCALMGGEFRIVLDMFASTKINDSGKRVFNSLYEGIGEGSSFTQRTSSDDVKFQPVTGFKFDGKKPIFENLTKEDGMKIGDVVVVKKGGK